MRSNESGTHGLDQTGEQLLRDLDLLQSRAPVPDIEPPQLIDQAVRNMARRELPDRPAVPLAGSIRWIAGLATVSIALIAVGISMVQSPSPVPPAAESELKSEQLYDTRLESPAASRLAKERSAIPAAPESATSAASHTGAEQALTASSADADSAQARLELIRQLYDQGLLSEATEQLGLFSADYPEYPLPEWAAELQP